VQNNANEAALPWLDVLNPEQRQAVLHTGSPLLILAGAGTGKTRVITTKIAWLIREKGIDPRSILAVTFTNKAAREMAERARMIDVRAEYAMLRTFHSFGAWFLRRYGTLAGLNSNFVIYDDDDMISLLAAVLKNTPRQEVRPIAHYISRAKDYFLSPDSAELSLIKNSSDFKKNYALYEERLARTGNVDFGDLIKKPVEILRDFPEVAQRFRQQFKVIMVDEYQDANVAQFELLKALVGPDTYVCVVGDDDQSIYRFRGAEVKNILEFPDRFPNTEIIRLERNYRSTQVILSAASSVVDYNKGRLGKTLNAQRGKGKQPVLAFLPDQDSEASYCADLIENSVVKNKNAQWQDWAILYRTNAQSRSFETEFLRRKIPYRVVGSLKFYEREEIKDALALLAFTVNPADEVAFRRVINKPARGVGQTSLEKIINEYEKSGCDLEQAANNAELSAKARSGIKTFLEIIKNARTLLTPSADTPVSDKKIRKHIDKQTDNKKDNEEYENLVPGEGLSVCVEMLLRESGIAEYHQVQDEINSYQRLFNMQELIDAASLYPASREGLLEFLELIELDRSRENHPEGTGANNGDMNNAVTLITFHNTKGLEFPRVIMTGLEQGVFPREDKHGDELEEERRLFYVGVTRAMDELYFCCCKFRIMYGHIMPCEPSRFLSEIDRGSLRVIGNAQYTSGFSHNAAQKQPESDCGWRLGDRLYHDDHGYGAVINIRDSEDGPIVQVRFETGKEQRFLSEHQGSASVKIGNE